VSIAPMQTWNQVVGIARTATVVEGCETRRDPSSASSGIGVRTVCPKQSAVHDLMQECNLQVFARHFLLSITCHLFAQYQRVSEAHCMFSSACS
jgi:ABC-type Na+ transport system ATPase subunit NatA